MRAPMKTKFLLILLTVALLSPLGALADYIVVKGRRYVSIDDVAARYQMRSSDQKSQVTISKQGARAVFFPDKRYVLINGRRYTMSFAALRSGKLYLAQLDVNTMLDPVLGQRSVPRHPLGTIVLDPGHGGKDNGAQGAVYREKDLTLKLSRKVSDLLKRAGYNIVLTRNSDVYLTLDRRVQIAREKKANLFLSIHVNATQDRSISGIESYAMTPANAPSSNSERPDSDAYIGNRNDLNNMAIAHELQRSMLTKTGAVDRGFKRARFHVLRSAPCPATLVEIGFISNRAEERKLGNDAYLDTLARGIADGVLQYHRTLLRKQ